ncbi:AAA family ATPase [Rhizobiaceae bacterium BDR2-2]|uniref:AAA family ATPase n=1 Tax=Ectorhizobium quercum TaxID=2965071 RepID=A0AAE3SWU0_9HYPH|nr:AAA family ATPase [Ectorhizobium quercum]MCX8997765.1 AAA family ATPase [Ectorhizobium quercum]
MPNYLASIEDAVPILRSAGRVLVVGCSGGGKSTLAQRLAARFALAYISMDRDFLWLPGWVLRERAGQRALIAEAVKADRWIMDGNNAPSFDLRLPRTDIVLWVRLPRRLCLWGVAKRVVRHYGQTRPDMAEGCPEQLPDRAFLTYIWKFEKRHAPALIRSLDRYGPEVPVLTLKSHRETGKLLDLLDAAA